jgi:transposase
MSAYFSEMFNIEHQTVIKFFTLKGLNATEINKELDNIYRDSTPSYRTITKWVAEFRKAERGFEDAP